MLNLNEEEIKFLEDLSLELKNQETDYQATPRFWVIADYKDTITADGYEDYQVYIFPEMDYMALKQDELLEFMLKNEDDLFEEEELKEIDDFKRFNFCFEYQRDRQIMEYAKRIDKDVRIECVKDEHFIVKNTMFITKQEAIDHLKNNSHHYTNRAHTYAMSAWRAPKVSELFRILEKIKVVKD